MADLPVESTIDEPVRVTLLRDANRVARRMKLVLKPQGNGAGGSETHDEMKAELRNWDLWGPLVICMLLAVLLSIFSPPDQAATVFCAVFGIIWRMRPLMNALMPRIICESTRSNLPDHTKRRSKKK